MFLVSSSVQPKFRSCLGIFVMTMAPAITGYGDLIQSWEIGEGQSSAMVQFDFRAGNTYTVEVAFDDAISGQGLLDLIVSESGTAEFDFAYESISYSFGDFLIGIALENDADYGDGSTPPYVDYWHYWTRDLSAGWTESMTGFSDRILIDGESDAWVFGTTDAPALIPAPASLAVMISAFFGGGRRGRRVH